MEITIFKTIKKTSRTFKKVNGEQDTPCRPGREGPGHRGAGPMGTWDCGSRAGWGQAPAMGSSGSGSLKLPSNRLKVTEPVWSSAWTRAACPRLPPRPARRVRGLAAWSSAAQPCHPLCPLWACPEHADLVTLSHRAVHHANYIPSPL